MNTDKRVISGCKPFTCLDAGKALEYKGKPGFFANDLCEYADLDQCTGNFLTEVSVKSNYPFSDDADTYKFFLPECFTVPKSEYRPYTLKEFTWAFPQLRVIRFRPKDEDVVYNLTFLGFTEDEYNPEDSTVILGLKEYTLQELFDGYELDDNGVFRPFGKEIGTD